MAAVIAVACAGDATDERTVLDGTAALQPIPLADLALARALLGARWLANVVGEDGAFAYEYDPGDDEYLEDQYNETRHAGVTWSLFQVAGAANDGQLKDAAARAADYIVANSIDMLGGRGFSYQGQVKLGAQALAIVALIEGRRVLGTDRYDEILRDLGAGLLAMEIAPQTGQFYSYFRDGLLTTEGGSEFYPGEALLALARLAEAFPDGGYLDAARRLARWMTRDRYGDLLALPELPDVDHWLTLALERLHRLAPEDDYAAVVALEADAIIADQATAADGAAIRIGANLGSSINYTSTATRSEALVAAWALAQRSGNQEALARWADAARRRAQFQMRVQYVGDEVGLFPRPDLVEGGWPGSVEDGDIRIDYVQHNMSALIGLWYLTRRGEIP